MTEKKGEADHSLRQWMGVQMDSSSKKFCNQNLHRKALAPRSCPGLLPKEMNLPTGPLESSLEKVR
jgi:hypothetical protein